jgi:hypothetical protein
LPAQKILRIFLSGLSKRRIQPERYAKWGLNVVEIIMPGGYAASLNKKMYKRG